MVVFCSGHFDTVVRLWQYIKNTNGTDGEIRLIATLGESRSSAVTSLALTYTCSLLAVGNEDGCVSVWDMEVCKARYNSLHVLALYTQDGSLLKYFKLQKKVTHLQWTKWGLAACTVESKVTSYLYVHLPSYLFSM